MSIEVDDASAGELCPQPGKAEIDSIELQDCPAWRAIDENVDIPFQAGIPSSLVHVELPPNPVFLITFAQLCQPVILAPIVVDVFVSLIGMSAACTRIEPPSLIERLIIRSTARKMSK